MTQSLADVAAALRAASGSVAEVRVRIAGVDPGPAAFAMGATGQLGSLAARLHRLWSSALDARTVEAADLVGRLDSAADDVDRAARRYLASDDDARGLWTEGS
jgi:Excreted virulence factor EspC, type VII ESX diderm